MKRTPFLFWLGALILVIGLAYAGYIFWQNSSVHSQLNVADQRLGDLQGEVLKFENQKVEEAIAAKETVNALELTGVEWSEIIREIRKTVPESRGETVLEVLSYSASGPEKISLSVETTEDSREPYEDVAAMIRAFDESVSFTDNFVPSIASGINDEGKEILSFNFTTTYVAEDDRVEPVELEQSLSEIIEESLEEDSQPVAR